MSTSDDVCHSAHISLINDRNLALTEMKKASKYDPLKSFLLSNDAPVVILDFAEIAALVGGLPATAEKRAEWWGNERSADSKHVQCKSWLEAGYLAEVNRFQKRVKFQKIRR